MRLLVVLVAQDDSEQAVRVVPLLRRPHVDLPHPPRQQVVDGELELLVLELGDDFEEVHALVPLPEPLPPVVDIDDVVQIDLEA